MVAGIVAGSVFLVLFVLVGGFLAVWRVAEPNEALVISGTRSAPSSSDAADSMLFRIVTGHGTLVVPGL